MHDTHSLDKLDGMNPRTARKLFDLTAKEWNGVSWDDFRKFCGSHLACFRKESRWIPGDLFRNYFASLDGGAAAGKFFVRMYSERKHKNGNGENGTGGGGHTEDTREVLSSAVASIAAEIIAEGSTRERLEALTTLSGSLAELDRAS
jgi:hypothetical protein